MPGCSLPAHCIFTDDDDNQLSKERCEKHADSLLPSQFTFIESCKSQKKCIISNLEKLVTESQIIFQLSMSSLLQDQIEKSQSSEINKNFQNIIKYAER